MSDKSEKQAYEEITKLTSEAYKCIAAAEEIAKKHGLEFSFSVEYGMGGTFYGAGNDYYLSKGEPGWVSSSSTC